VKADNELGEKTDVWLNCAVFKTDKQFYFNSYNVTSFEANLPILAKYNLHRW